MTSEDHEDGRGAEEQLYNYQRFSAGTYSRRGGPLGPACTRGLGLGLAVTGAGGASGPENSLRHVCWSLVTVCVRGERCRPVRMWVIREGVRVRVWER